MAALSNRYLLDTLDIYIASGYLGPLVDFSQSSTLIKQAATKLKFGCCRIHQVTRLAGYLATQKLQACLVFG